MNYPIISILAKERVLGIYRTTRIRMHSINLYLLPTDVTPADS